MYGRSGDGETGFLITGKDEFLDPFNTGQSELKKAIAEMNRLVASAHDRPATVFDLADLSRLNARWIAEVAEPEIQARRQVTAGEKTQQDLAIVLKSSTGASLLKRMRAVLDRLTVRFVKAKNDRLQALLGTVDRSIVDQETGQRGFLRTGIEELLQPYKRGRTTWIQAITSLRALNAKAYDLPKMKANLNRVEKLAAKWIVKAAGPESEARRVMDKHPESLHDVAKMLEAGTGKRILDSIRAEFDLFIDEEETLTATRYEAASTEARTTSRTTVILTAVSVIFGGCMALMITLSITRPVGKLAVAVDRVANGDLTQEIQNSSNDEIGLLSRSFNQMAGNLRNLEYDREMNAGQLEQYNGELANEANLQYGQLTLTALVQETRDLETLGDAVAGFLADRTESQVAAFYIGPLRQGEGEGELRLVGSYAFPHCEEDSCTYGNRLALLDQVKRSKKSLVVSDLPDDYINVSSGLGAARPRHLLIVPMLDGKRVNGVIELGSFTGFSDEEINETESLVQLVAPAIYARQGAEKIQSLLRATQDQAEKLEGTNAELKATSAALHRQKVAIEERNRDLEVVRSQLEENARELELASQYKSEFLANMSHEIRSPMTAIMGFTEIVRDRVNDPENKDWLDKIQRNDDHLLGVINDILDISKVESNKLTVEAIDVSPAQILADVSSLLGVRATGKGLTLHVEFDGPIPQRIKTDPTRLRQILVNLVGNAIKFTEVGEVRLVARVQEADSDHPRIIFDVSDTGIGMTADQMDGLFQPFVQADTSTIRKFGGTGLGLAISKRLAEMLGDGISVHSVPDEGSTFTAFISTGPLNGVPMVNSMAEFAATVIPTTNAVDQDVRLSCRVLLAEDGPDNQKLIAFVLTKAGAEVEVAKNGQVALDMALAARDKGNAFDVILMDMQMPVLDGYDATAKLREAGYPGPVLALTAHAMSGDRDKCIDAGCDDYTTKPIDRKELIGLVAQYATQSTPREVQHVDG